MLEQEPDSTGGLQLATTYREARDAFLAAARGAGATLREFRHPMAGLEGEPLAVDVASLGPRSAEAAMLVVSGTHGVEGYAGSAMQTHWLRTCSAARPHDVRLVLVHALNPFGFSWCRRVNEDNVDLNRNFVDWAQPLPNNRGYERLASDLVPDAWDEESQKRAGEAIAVYAAEFGLAQTQHDISHGQYTHPDGIFFGGSGPTWSARTLRLLVQEELSEHTRLAVVDLHTGLGAWGEGQLIVIDNPGSDWHRRACDFWAERHVIWDRSNLGVNVDGDWLGRLSGWLPHCEITAAALEWGTVDSLLVLDALRADAVLHAHGRPTAPEAAAIRSKVRAAFADDNPAWLARLWPAFQDIVGLALGRLTGGR